LPELRVDGLAAPDACAIEGKPGARLYDAAGRGEHGRPGKCFSLLQRRGIAGGFRGFDQERRRSGGWVVAEFRLEQYPRVASAASAAERVPFEQHRFGTYRRLVAGSQRSAAGKTDGLRQLTPGHMRLCAGEQRLHAARCNRVTPVLHNAGT
jgi:hypothetical protein